MRARRLSPAPPSRRALSRGAVFAVRQWPGNRADLDFRPVVKLCRAFVLVAAHLDEVAAIPPKYPRSRTTSHDLVGSPPDLPRAQVAAIPPEYVSTSAGSAVDGRALSTPSWRRVHGSWL